MKTKSNKRGMTLRELYEKVYFVIDKYRHNLITISQINKDHDIASLYLLINPDESILLKFEKTMNEYHQIPIYEMVIDMRERLLKTFYESGFRFLMFSHEEEKEKLLKLLKEYSITPHEILILILLLIQEDDFFIIHNLLEGYFISAIDLLKKNLNVNSTRFDQQLMNIYQAALNQMYNLCTDKEEAAKKYKTLNRLIEKERPLNLKYTSENNQNSASCPRCKNEIRSIEQNYCSNCGQKIRRS